MNTSFLPMHFVIGELSYLTFKCEKYLFSDGNTNNFCTPTGREKLRATTGTTRKILISNETKYNVRLCYIKNIHFTILDYFLN